MCCWGCFVPFRCGCSALSERVSSISQFKALEVHSPILTHSVIKTRKKCLIAKLNQTQRWDEVSELKRERKNCTAARISIIIFTFAVLFQRALVHLILNFTPLYPLFQKIIFRHCELFLLFGIGLKWARRKWKTKSTTKQKFKFANQVDVIIFLFFLLSWNWVFHSEILIFIISLKMKEMEKMKMFDAKSFKIQRNRTFVL